MENSEVEFYSNLNMLKFKDFVLVEFNGNNSAYCKVLEEVSP